MAEGFIEENPIAKIKIAKSKPKVVVPFKNDEISRMLEVCDYDYEHNAKLLGSRNRAIILVLFDTGMRLSELVGMKVRDINNDTGYIQVLGKGSKERVVRIGKMAQKALWRNNRAQCVTDRTLRGSLRGAHQNFIMPQCPLERWYTLAAVSWNRAAFSLREKFSQMHLKAFHITLYEYDALSTGKLLSNIHRSTPNCSIHW